MIQELPIELLTYALTLGLAVHPCPSHILCVCKTWEAIATPVLHKNIQFTRFSQLKALISYPHSKRRRLLAPYSITFAKTVNSKSDHFFHTIDSVFQSINLSSLEVVKLNVHSHNGEGSVFDAFKLIKYVQIYGVDLPRLTIVPYPSHPAPWYLNGSHPTSNIRYRYRYYLFCVILSGVPLKLMRDDWR